MIGHYNQRSIIYPISAKAQRNGRSLINWLTLLADRGDGTERESWDRKVGRARFFDRFSDWNFPWIKLADLICATAEIFEYPMCDRDPLPRWSFGRVTLVGDAAHPMRPVGSQAGSQGIVDARIWRTRWQTMQTRRGSCGLRGSAIALDERRGAP
jgi:2-polyprenyl-6-methoxyphenol hydroxylase-like FAD-dependent oxidoreductase